MKEHLVITMSDKTYFENGKYFLETRKRVDADFLLYSPNDGLAVYQMEELNKNDIELRYIQTDKYFSMMQTLKFYYLYWNLLDYKYITFCDFDTYFVNDWKHVFEHDFSLGITTTESYPQWKHLRSKANGGVIFCKRMDSTSSYLYDTIEMIKNGQGLKQYDEIWKTLEDPKRGPNKQKFRTDLAWWCDQVALSALILRDSEYIKQFPCKQYNQLESAWNPKIEPGVYIRHLKGKNRPVKGVSCG